MKTYKIQFFGRRIGALGVSSWHTVTVAAETPEAARLKLYDTHEHIERCIIAEVTE